MNFGQHVRSDRSKWAVTAIAILLIGVILAAILTNGFKDGNPYCWFGHDYDENGICIKCGAEKPAEQPDEEDPDKQPEEDKDELSNLAITPALSKGVRLYAARPTVLENNVITQTLTAFIEPEDADNQSVTWSIAWQNPASEYATGKTVTDYVTVTPESDGSLTATVSCLQDFGEKVVVTVTAEDNAEIKATAVCDYLQRVESLEFTASEVEFPGSGYTYEVVYSDYTIPVDIDLTISNKMTLTTGFVNAIKTRHTAMNTGYKIGTDWFFSSGNSATLTIDYDQKKIGFYSYTKDFASCFGSPDDEYSSSEIAEIKAGVNNAFRYCVNSYVGAQATFDVSYSMTYEGNKYDSGSVTVECNFNYESLKVDVTNVTLSSSNIIF